MTGVQVVHHAGADLRAAVEALVDAATAALGKPALSDHLLLDLRSGGTAGYAGILLTEGDGLAAYGQLSASNEGAVFEIVIDPGHLRDRPAAVTRLLDAANTELRTRGGTMSWWVTEPTTDEAETAGRVGLVESRRLHLMRRPLPANRRSRVATRAFTVGRDEDAWIEVNNRAFAGHAEQGGWTAELLTTRQHEDWFDPDGFRLHERDGRLAAFCWTKVHDPGTPRAEGEIYVIAVDPDFQGLGLGRELTLAGLDHLSDAGITSAILYVAAENDSAVGLYRSLGFEVAMTRAAFTKNYPPPDPS